MVVGEGIELNSMHVICFTEVTFTANPFLAVLFVKKIRFFPCIIEKDGLTGQLDRTI